jgi:copper transport protein
MSSRATVRYRDVDTDHSRRRVRPLLLVWIVVVVALLGTLALTAAPASAHAFLKESDPAANAILPTSPPQVTLRFTERLERSYSQAELYDQTGTVVAGTASHAGDTASTMILDLPPGLPNGTFSVLWRTLSEDDGHTAQGYIAFTIGSEQDVQAVIVPAGATTGVAGPSRWATAGRWLSLLGLAGLVAVWPVWLLVLRPAISPVWQLGPMLVRRVRRLAFGALLVALVGSIIALLAQAGTVADQTGRWDALTTTVTGTRYGSLWLLRLGLFLIDGAMLVGLPWWWPRRRRIVTIGALLLATALPLPYSLISHASAQPAGRATAVANDMLHLLGASVWVGGLVLLLVGLTPALRNLTPRGRQTVLGRAIPRFSALALVAWAVMGLTGLYSAWLQVGNLTALRDTSYGRWLIIKLLLLVPVFLLAAFNLLVVTRRLRRAGEAGAAAWSRRFIAALAGEALIVVLVLLAVSRLIGGAPARDTLAQGGVRTTIDLEADGQRGILIMTPGAAGPNHYRLELGSGHNHSAEKSTAPTVALLRLELPAKKTGRKEIKLVQAAGDAYEGHGSELGIAGEWTIQVIVRQPGQNDWTVTTTHQFGATPPALHLPRPPWRFGTVGIAGMLLVVLGLAGLLLALLGRRGATRRQGAGLGTVALLLGVVVLLQARVGTGNASANLAAPSAAESAAVVRGQTLFASNCVTCHGPGGQGNGPAAAGLSPPPANLTASHSQLHRDEDIAYWIKNGITGSAMPGFGGRLADPDVADLIAYLRNLQSSAASARDAPRPEECRTEPRTLAGIRALVATPPAATPVSPVEVTGGDLANPPAVAGITATMRELTACSNGRDVMRRLALFSDRNLRATFPEGPSDAFASLAATPPAPVADPLRVALIGVQEARMLADGRVVARVTVDNPTRHTHAVPDPGTPAAQGQLEVARIVFVRAPTGERWLIDDVLP